MIEILKLGVDIRVTEQKLLEAYKERYFGGTVHTCLGQELCPSILSILVPKETKVISNHRGHGHYIAHTSDITGLFCEFLGHETAPSFGIGGSQHLHSDNFISNGIQGCTAPFAVGISMQRPVVFYLGDGTFGEGALYEALNMSKLVNGNILFVVEDNSISQSTPSKKVLSGSIANKFSAFDIEVVEVDSKNPEELLKTLTKERTKWFNGSPKAIIVKSYRLFSHSKGDDTRSRIEIESLPDPLAVLASLLNEDLDLLIDSAKQRIEQLWNESVQQDKLRFESRKRSTGPNFTGSLINDLELDKRLNNIINESIDSKLSSGALYIGEDIKTKWKDEDEPYGGAFGVSLGLSEKHRNVVSTSISEVGLVGVAAGYAYSTNQLAIAEIMFADFSTLIVDQLVNGVDKYKKMFGKNIKIPLAIRIPYGMGRGYGPTHSQSPFELFSSLTESIVISYNCLINYSKLLENIEESGACALIFESKTQYGERLSNWASVLDNYNVTEHPGQLSSSFTLSNCSFPKVNIITHGSYAKNVIDFVHSSSLEANIVIISEIYSDKSFLDNLNKELPLLLIEEANSHYSPLKIMFSSLNINNAYNGKVVCSKPVTNIPANQQWEKELMISDESLRKMVEEALM